MKNVLALLFFSFSLIVKAQTTQGVPCSVATPLNATGVTNTSAVLGWTSVNTASSYAVQYREVGQPAWIQAGQITAPATSTTLSGLTPATNYEFQVKTYCVNNQIQSAFTSSFPFTTLCIPVQSQITFPASNITICVASTPITLSAAPAGGTFSGTCVSGGVFTPCNGVNQIIYTPADACYTADTVVITVVDTLPAPGPSPIGGNLSVCNQSQSLYGVAPVAGATGYSWTITPANAGALTPTNNGLLTNVTWDTTFTGIAQISGAAVNACGAGPAYTYDVHVEGPFTNTTSGISPTVVCGNAPTTVFTANTIQGSYYPYFWSYTINGSTYTINGNNASATFNWANLTPANYCGELTITVKGGSTCGNGPPASFTVNRICDATPDIIPSGPYCVTNDTFHLSADIPGGVWSGCNVTPDGIFTPSTEGQCTVTYDVNINGCVGTASANIFVSPSATANISVPLQVCQNSTQTIVLQGSPQNGIFLPNDTVDTTLPGNFVYTYQVNGAYGCAAADTVGIEVIGLPVANFSYTASTCVVCFTDNSLNTTTWFWDYGDGVAGPDLDICHEYTVNGIYCVTLFATNACGTDDTTICIPIGCVGIEETEASQISIYPNPATDNLILNTGNFQNIQVELFDISGRKLLQQQAIQNLQSIDVSGLNNGVYICVVTSGNRVVKREKVVVSR